MATHPPSPAPGPAEFSLTPQGEYASRPPIRITKPIVLVGSDEHCHLHLVSSTVSRHHAMIVRDDDRVYVSDLGSRTKILVNGQEHRDAELANGDDVRIGKFSFKFSASRPPTRTAAHPEPARLLVDGQDVPAPPENRLVLIGRTAGSDVLLVEDSVSTRHAIIFEVGGKRYVRDLDSRTGTFLNNKKIHQQEIKRGDKLRIGKKTLTLAEMIKSPAAATELPAVELPPVEIEEPLSFEPISMPLAEEVELPPAALPAILPAAPVEEPIPLELEPIEPVEQPVEPATPVADHPLDDPLPFAEPLPLELEPEPPSLEEVGPSAAPAPVVARHPEEPLELEPELPPEEPIEAAPPLAPDIEHPEEIAPLEPEPEPIAAIPAAEEIVLPAITASGDANEETHLDLQPPPLEAEPVEQAAPDIETVVAAVVPEPLPEIEAPLAIDLSDAPEPESAPKTEPAPSPAARASSAMDLLEEFAAEPREEFKPVEFELEPTPEPVEQTVVPAAETINLSDAPSLLDLEPEPAPEPAPVEQTAVSSAATIDLSDTLAPVEVEGELMPEPEPAEHTAVSFDATIDLSDAPLPMELEPEPQSVEPAPVSSSATINLADVPSLKEVESEPASEPEPAEQPDVSSAAAIDLSDAPAPLELEPEPQHVEPAPVISSATINIADVPSLQEIESEPVPEPEPAEQTVVSSDATIDLSDAPTPLKLEPEPSPSLADKFSVVDSSKTVDLEIDSTPPEAEAEHGPINFDPVPMADEIPLIPQAEVSESIASAEVLEEIAPSGEASATIDAELANEVPSETATQKSHRGRKRQSPAEPKPPKVRKPRVKRVPPKVAAEEVFEAVEAPAPVESEPPAVEVPAIEIPDLAFDLASDQPPDSSLTISEPISAEVTLTAPADVIPEDHADEVPTEPPPAEPLPIEPPPIEPAPIEPVAELPPVEPPAAPPPAVPPLLPAKPFMSVGNFAHLTGGTVNLDHSLGGMPIKLQDLPPAPTGFGKVRVSLSGKASSPFSSFAKSDPLVFDEPEPIATQPLMLARPESVVAPPPPPLPPPVEAILETIVTPPPPPPPTQVQSFGAPPGPKAAPKPPRGPRLFAGERREIPVNDPRPKRADAAAFGQVTTAFDGLAPAPAFREADAFSNVEAIPVNDAAFGGARLSRSDEYNVPESPETAARLADGQEHDFAEDDFWNRTDEDDGLTPTTIPSAEPTPMVSSPEDYEDLTATPVAPVSSVLPASPVLPPEDYDEFTEPAALPVSPSEDRKKSAQRAVSSELPVSPSGGHEEFAVPPASPVPATEDRKEPTTQKATLSELPVPSVMPPVDLEEFAVLPASPVSPPKDREEPIQWEASFELPVPVVLPPAIDEEFDMPPVSPVPPLEDHKNSDPPELLISSVSPPVDHEEFVVPPASPVPPSEDREEPTQWAASSELPEASVSPPAVDEEFVMPPASPVLPPEDRKKPSRRPASPVLPALPPPDLEDTAFPGELEMPADPIEHVAPIPAEVLDLNAEIPDFGEESGSADNPDMESREPASSHSAVLPEQPIAPTPRRRRRFRIPFLMPILLLAIGLSLGGIWRFTPVQSQIVGKMTFGNYNWTPGTRDGNEFEAAQRRLLDGEQTRRNAVEFLRRDHPDVSPGFLAAPDAMGRVVSSVSLNAIRDAAPAQTVLQLSYSGANKDDDRLRMMAFLQSLVDSNAPLLDGNRRLRNAQQQAQQAVDETQQKLDQIKTQLASLQTVIDAQPATDEMAKLTAHRAQLEKARDDAEEAVNHDHSELARLEAAAPGAVTAAATAPADPSDAQLKQMRQQLADLAAEMDSAHSDQLAGAVLARQQLENSAKQFSDQLATADEVLGSSSQLRQFVDSARDSQAKARELINILIVDGEDLEKQLEDTRRDVEGLIQARQEQKWEDDPQLQQLRESFDSAQHRYNANVGDGNKDPRVLDPLQKEVDNWMTQIKARQQQLGVDPSEVKVEEGLNNLVQSLRNKLQSEKQLIGQVLDPLEKQLNQLDPVVSGMPAAEQDLAKQLRQRLDSLNDARKKYAEAVGEGGVAPSPKVTELQKQITELKDRAEQREQNLAQQKVRSRDATHMQDIEKAKNSLDADQKALDAAKSTYGEVLLVFEEKQAERDAAEAAQQKKISLLDTQQTANTELEAAQRDRDEKQAAAEHAFDIKPITDADVMAAATTDPRMMYSLIVLGAGVVLLAGLTFASHTAAHRAHQIGASGHHHEPPRIAEQIDSPVLPMASDPPSGR